ncbi:class I SAM-dependent methyltransferase [Halorubrum sp. Atlit-8R]|uniref:class I SAM-dependent methyltransferase n=1 Tax=unclassified Halorubrum TaxID=2642239 RepID=UPI000EF22448|nr:MULTISPECIES: class I SAM-dependent methyltransferase [unclassified Halorubrum]RLM63938.1 class I SAM-dependent methyltransferase [Halorubrum sp. Atlit-9R]RLM77316.1 class I SAM-dependent methyltransferase [Halorubrum sp. Atlit-8R]
MTDAHRENRRLWNEWSDAFQALWNAETDTYPPPVPTPFDPDGHAATGPEFPPSAEGEAVVELGCGGGQGSVGTALAGAERVVGVDISEDQLRHARRLRDHYGADARFVQGDVTRAPLASDAFDLAFSEAAFQLVADVEAAVREARRVLRPGGTFYLAVMHPFRELIDPDDGAPRRGYHAPPRREIEIDESYDADLVAFDRTVSDLHRALTDAGFVVERLVEPEPEGGETTSEGDAAAAAEPRALLPDTLGFWARLDAR